MKDGIAAVVLSCTALAAPAGAAEGKASYGEELGQVYRAYQEMAGRQEACIEAFPGMRSAVEKGYADWRGRNAKTVAELDERLTSMIRGAYGDDKAYARSIGKYQGALLQQRAEARKALLAQPRDALEALCNVLPDLLASKESDLETLYADELRSLRSRR